MEAILIFQKVLNLQKEERDLEHQKQRREMIFILQNRRGQYYNTSTV
jgi:hypothetical protein